MFHSVLLLFIGFNIFHDGLSLVALPSVKENHIMKTEAAIRNTVNGLLESLRTAPEKAPKLEQYLRIHNYFLSLTLKDYHSLKEIEKLSRVLDNRNVTTVLMDTINDILNENTKEQYQYKTAEVKNSFKEIDDFAENINQLTAKYQIPHNDTKVSNATKKIQLGKKLKEILGTSDNGTKSQSGEFWVERSRRIYSSKKAKISQFPFMVVVQIFGQFYCAGALIGNDLVITAASCMQLAWNNRYFRENLGHVSVRIGSTFPTIGGEVISVIEIYFNPNYNPSTLQANLALLRLSRKINFEKSRRVKKIIFDHNPSQIPFSTAGVSVLGWGSKNEGNKVELKTFLQLAKLDIYILKDCQDIYSRKYVRYDNICVGYSSRGGGACNHDIGDPGVVNSVLVGIVSFASPVCGRANSPTVLTKLGYHSEWIESVLEMEPPNRLMPFTSPRPTLGRVTYVEETTPKIFTPLPDNPQRQIPLKISETLLTYFNNDTNLYETFIKTCNDKDVIDFAKALKGHGLEMQVSKRRGESKTVYMK